MVGAGFAAVENTLFAVGSYAEGGADEWLSTIQIRLAFGTLVHMGASGIFGATLGYASRTRRGIRPLAPLAAMLGALVVHGGWNAFLVASRTDARFALGAVLVAAGTLGCLVWLYVDAVRRLRTPAGDRTSASS